jgi:hypothetical protein
VTESGRAIETVAGVEKIGIENGNMVLRVGQGRYELKVES